jgi:hypothetical protein
VRPMEEGRKSPEGLGRRTMRVREDWSISTRRRGRRMRGLRDPVRFLGGRRSTRSRRTSRGCVVSFFFLQFFSLLSLLSVLHPLPPIPPRSSLYSPRLCSRLRLPPSPVSMTNPPSCSLYTARQTNLRRCQAQAPALLSPCSGARQPCRTRGPDRAGEDEPEERWKQVR